MDDPQEHLTPEHLSLLAAILSQPGARPEDAVKQALGLFDMARLHLAIRSSRLHPTFQRLKILMEDVFPPEKRISIKAAYDAAGNAQYKNIEAFQRALSRFGLVLTVSDAGQERIETSITAVQLLWELIAERSRIRDRERKKKKRSNGNFKKSSADKMAPKADKEEEIRKLKGQKRKSSTKIRNTIPPP